MRKFGLIGYPLTHSFSKKYFAEKFGKEAITDSAYDLYEIEDINQFPQLVSNIGDELEGLNVTIPHKQSVIQFLDHVEEAAAKIGAVNVIKRDLEGQLTGYNSDYYGFKNSLIEFLGGGPNRNLKALVLGTGGASKAICQALSDLKINYLLVSRNKSERAIAYDQIKDVIKDHKLIINTTPLGTYPKTDTFPALPYSLMDDTYYLYDLTYNPEITTFMKKGKEFGAHVINGLPMLIGQAEKAWKIWNS